MEYSRVNQPSDPVEFPDNKRAVKFYAYNTNTGNQVFAADLDGNGARPLPQLCAVSPRRRHRPKSFGSRQFRQPDDPSIPSERRHSEREFEIPSLRPPLF